MTMRRLVLTVLVLSTIGCEPSLNTPKTTTAIPDDYPLVIYFDDDQRMCEVRLIPKGKIAAPPKDSFKVACADMYYALKRALAGKTVSR